MTLSLVFSVLFYFSSTAGLDVQVGPGLSGSSSLNTGTVGNNQVGDGPAPPPSATLAAPSNSEQLAHDVSQFIGTIRRELLLRLAVFNCAMLPVGLLVSRWLAGRTLQPVRRAIEAQMRFASDASHELRTPLAIMQTELEVTLARPRLTLSRARQALKSNLEETRRLQTLAESLLLLARDEVLPRAQQPIASLVAEAVNAVATVAQKKDITLIITQTTAGSAYVHSSSMVQAVVMLLDNAIKYSPPGSTVSIASTQLNGHVHLCITDQGKGISPQELPHVRKRFYQTDTTQPGHGLGLSIVNKIVHEHEGTLEIHSQVDKGSTFTIILPAKD